MLFWYLFKKHVLTGLDLSYPILVSSYCSYIYATSYFTPFLTPLVTAQGLGLNMWDTDIDNLDQFFKVRLTTGGNKI